MSSSGSVKEHDASTTRVLLVRAVNVGGTARLPMADFRQLLTDVGAESARTYIASGNAVVSLPSAWTAVEWTQFDRAVETELESRFGFHRDVISRSIDDVQASLAAHPFDIQNPQWSYIAFLASEPKPERLARAAELSTGTDEWRLLGSDLHLRYANGMGNASLKLDALLKRLDTAGTARNLRSVNAILALATQ